MKIFLILLFLSISNISNCKLVSKTKLKKYNHQLTSLKDNFINNSKGKFQKQKKFQVNYNNYNNYNENNHTSISFIHSLLAGGLSRVLSQILLHPLDSLRTRAQLVSSRSNSLNNLFERKNNLQVSLGRRKTLFRGILPQIIFSGPAGALHFGVLERMKSLFLSLKLSPTISNILSSSIGSLIATIIRIPQEEIKVACQSQRYSNAIEAFISLYKLHGLNGFYRNGLIVILRDVLWHTISYTLFQTLKSYHLKKSQHHFSKKKELVIGVFVGTIACILTHPLDVIRTVMMTSSSKQSIKSIFNDLKLQSGALSSGLLYRIMYLAPMSSLSYVFYDIILNYLRRKRNYRQS